MTSEESSDSVDQPTNNIVPSFSFSGCGFLGVYHIGVAICLRDHTDVCNRKEILWGGASAGALVATTLLSGMDFGQMTRLLLKVAKTVRNKESVDLALILKDLLNRNLSDDVHRRLKNRLHVSMTTLNGLGNVLVTDFHSKEHFVECLIASSFVPGFMGWIPPSLDAEDFLYTSMGVRQPVNILSDSDTDDSEVTDQEEDGEPHTRRQSKRLHVPLTSFDTDSIWGVCAYDSKHDDWKGTQDESKLTGRKKNTNESYFKKVMRLCFSGLKTTTSIVRIIPGASLLMDKVAPGALDGMDELVEAIILEMLANKQTVLDGGFSVNIPIFDNNTITICPFAGESDICPRDPTCTDMNIELGGTSMHTSEDNIFRLNHALSPMSPELLLKLCEDGYNECLQYLHKNNLLSCKKHFMTRAVISSSPCNIGHSICKCRVCLDAQPKIQKSLSCVDCQKVEHIALSSVLPADVRREFDLAIEEYKHQKHSCETNYWHRLIAALWWCAEKMYAGSMRLVDLTQDFHLWLLRFWDSIACLKGFAEMHMARKREMIRRVLSSLLAFLRTSAQSRSAPTCSRQGLQPLCT